MLGAAALGGEEIQQSLAYIDLRNTDLLGRQSLGSWRRVKLDQHILNQLSLITPVHQGRNMQKIAFTVIPIDKAKLFR